MHLTGAYATIPVAKLVLDLAGVIALVLDGQLPAKLRAGPTLVMAYIDIHYKAGCKQARGSTSSHCRILPRRLETRQALTSKQVTATYRIAKLCSVRLAEPHQPHDDPFKPVRLEVSRDFNPATDPQVDGA